MEQNDVILTLRIGLLPTSSQRIVTKGRIVEGRPPNCPLPRGVRTPPG